MRRAARLALLLVALSGSEARAGTYDATPAAIQAVRQTYADVVNLAAQGALLQFRRDFSCPGTPDGTRTLWRDAAGRVRRYAFTGGTGDQALTVTEYFTPETRLAFTLIEAGATNGTTVETRVYFGPAGNVLRADERRVKGPGYPFAPFWTWITPLPEVAFNAPAPCP